MEQPSRIECQFASSLNLRSHDFETIIFTMRYGSYSLVAVVLTLYWTSIALIAYGADVLLDMLSEHNEYLGSGWNASIPDQFLFIHATQKAGFPPRLWITCIVQMCLNRTGMPAVSRFTYGKNAIKLHPANNSVDLDCFKRCFRGHAILSELRRIS